MTNTLRLFYVSSVSPGVGEEDITDILVTARAHNKKAGITGVLCFRGGYFAQILEGPELAVLEIFVKIARDKRHTEPILITISTTTTIKFDSWHMGGITQDQAPFVGIDEILQLRNDAGEHGDAPLMMHRWLELLVSQPESRPR